MNNSYRNTARTLALCKWFALGAVLASIPILMRLFESSMWTLLTCLWLMIFFGACTTTSMVGIVISYVPPAMVTISSGLLMFCIAMFGFCLCPVVSGMAMQITNDPVTGMQTVVLGGALAGICMLIAVKTHGSTPPLVARSSSNFSTSDSKFVA